MIKSSPWPKLLPPLGVVLAIVLLAAVAVIWWNGAPAVDAGLGQIVSLTQAARADSRSALSGDETAFDALAAADAESKKLRGALALASGADPAARAFASDAALWRGVDENLSRLLAARDMLLDIHAARERLLGITPQLLAATGNLASALPPADVGTNQSSLDRFELSVQTVQQSLRSLAAATAIDEAVQRLSSAEQFLGQIIRGLRGEDTSLGITPVRGQAAQSSLDEATRLFAETRSAIDAIVAGAPQLDAAAAAVSGYDNAAAAVLARYRGGSFGAGAAAASPLAGLPLILVGSALAVVLLMMFVYYRARDFRRAAEIQAEQNERNQQAILRLLDELSSLADGDLTVQATVTEDITGAIADSINYAIEALRELVATVNDSSILVDAAAKQTEATSKHLLRASETQAKQAAAASESMGRMAASIEEVSGNAERCSDVARHSVEIAHKGGEAVRRTIAGMNTIRETIQDTSKRIKRLGESSQEIGNIVELIEEIAEQTNILALNASIEASRAGEASRGFAVVADEVQKLAERSTNATKKIEVLVSTIQSDTNEAVVSMERSTTDVVGGALLAENAGAALDEIEQVSHQIASLVQNISGSSKEQTSVAGAITKNMHVLREISAKTTESTAATSSAISKLSELASQLRRTVAGFTLPDQHGSTGVLSAARVAANLQKPAADADEPEGEPGLEATVIERRRQSG
ncbi:MAG TPA: methyl-accepting chemotaxis protein [Gammaproteobacteria bacterium]|nr:methyl-accepting chemotaxis protein [Gammaproteobacteria bacterium]